MKLKVQQRGNADLKDFEKACCFFVKELLPKKIIKKLDILVEFINQRKFSGKDDEGEIKVLDKVYGYFKPHRKFHIKIRRSLSDDEKLETLAHEFIHVAQNASGKLMERMQIGKCFYNMKWDGKYYGDFDRIEYHKRPWEIEAFENERVLFYKYSLHKVNLSLKIFDKLLEV